MKHVSRTHRVTLYWLFDRVTLDPKFQIKYVDTKNQHADMLTKGKFTRDDWNNLLRLFNIMNFSILRAVIVYQSVQLESRTPCRSELRKERQEKGLWWRNQASEFDIEKFERESFSHVGFVYIIQSGESDWVGILISQALRDRCETELKTHRRVLKCRTEVTIRFQVPRDRSVS